MQKLAIYSNFVTNLVAVQVKSLAKKSISTPYKKIFKLGKVITVFIQIFSLSEHKISSLKAFLIHGIQQ